MRDMLVQREFYVIATKKFPIKFLDFDEELTEDIREATYFDIKEEAEEFISSFSIPANYQIIVASIIY